MRRPRIAAFGVLAVFSTSGIAQAAPSRITSVPVDRVQVLDGGYERVSGTLRGSVSGTERVRGLPAAGLSYTADYEIIRPKRGRRVRLLLVEAENRGSPVVLNALSGGSASGGPRSAVYARSVSRFLRAERLAYARVQWQTGFAAGVPASAQGVGEVIVRDFGRYLARRYPRRALVGASQGAFFVNTFIAEGFNALARGRRAYSQALTVDGTGNWMAINRLAGSGPQDPYLRRNGRPLRLPADAAPAAHRPAAGGRGQLHRLLPAACRAHEHQAAPCRRPPLRLAVAAPVLPARSGVRRPWLQRAQADST